MVFKHNKVIRKSSQEPPLFVGPMMLHGDSKCATYLNFFSTINGALNGSDASTSEFRVQDNVVTGLDDETAMVNAAKTAFPNSIQLFCLVHVKDNVCHRLMSISVPVAVREGILSRLFSCLGVAEATNETEQDDRIAELLQFVRQHNDDAVDYFKDRVLPEVSMNNRTKWRESWIGQRQWTNNKCESVDHILKTQVTHE